MIFVEFLVVLLAVFMGARLGGIAIGFAGGVGILVLSLLGVPPGNIPFDVISIIMAVISAISAMQAAGGMDYLVKQAEKLLKKHPKYITLLAPMVTYWLTIFAGTGNISLSMLPVITEVSKSQGIRPCRPLSTAVVASQIAITASPISAAVVYIAAVFEPKGISYLSLLGFWIPSTLMAVCIMSLVVSYFFSHDLATDSEYIKRKVDLAKKQQSLQINKDVTCISTTYGFASVILFLLGVIAVVAFAVATSPSLHIVEHPLMKTTDAILIIMLTVATLITLLCKIKPDEIFTQSSFKAGMCASVCILGVAWLGDSFISHNIDFIKEFSGQAIREHVWLLSVVLFLASSLLYSQAATAKALIPMVFALAISPDVIIASFAAVSGLFILPTYPTSVTAVMIDDTGSTRIGKYVFNHPFFIPGILSVALSIILCFIEIKLFF